MASTSVQQVLCPVCHQSDQVRKVPVAYETGVGRLAPPVMPVAHVGMMGYITVGFVLVAFGVFFILVLSGTNGYGSWPGPIQVLQVVLTIAAIVVALVLSLIAFLRVLRGDQQTQKFLPAYDQAMDNWRRLYYCKRDDVIFDPETNKTLTDAAFKSLTSVEAIAQSQETPQASLAHH
ncbi:MAG TPA: hypothetical protein VFA41_13340 [Ktedonobacteraceae bacterium]|nr:hypothetical protein [Ktedonobacteraceae bacterium]